MSTESVWTATSGGIDRLADDEHAEISAMLLMAGGDLEGLLAGVARLAVDFFVACDVADIILIRDHKAFARGASDAIALELDPAQFSSGGPGVNAYSIGRTCHVASIRTETRWPAFTRIATELGIHSVMAIPITVQGSTIGALSLYSRTELSFSETDSQVGRYFVERVGVAVANTESYAATVQNAEALRTAMISRTTIDRATGILMAERHCAAERALDLLVERSQRESRTLSAIAQELVDQATRVWTTEDTIESRELPVGRANSQ